MSWARAFRKDFAVPFLSLALAFVFVSSVLAAPPTLNGNQRPIPLLSLVTPAPLTPFCLEDGGVTSLARHRGAVVLLNIWATRCAACLHELPALDRLKASYPDRQLRVLTVSVDEAGHETIRRYFSRLGVRHLPALADPTARSIDVFGNYDGLPWSMVIDPAGQLRTYLMGAASWDTKEARTFSEYFFHRKMTFDFHRARVAECYTSSACSVSC